MEGKCSLLGKCDSFHKGVACEGCGFQHFDKILKAHTENETLKFLGERYFALCSAGERKRGGRIALDKPVRDLFRRRLPENAKELGPQKKELAINGEPVTFEIKSDGAFEVEGKYIFYEVKGAGDNTNDVLSAITAAQLLTIMTERVNYRYYYIGISSGKGGNEGGLQRKDFFKPERTKIYPYVRWAEKNGFLRFFGIVDIDDLLKEIEAYLASSK